MVRVEKKKFTKEYRIKEIQKNLTKKARLKKHYLKALKEEGYSVPDKPIQQKPRITLEEQKSQNKKKVEDQRKLHKQRKHSDWETQKRHKEDELSKIQMSKNKQVEREKRSKKLNQRTRRGQPLMGPKINDLLDKIKNDETYS